MYPTPLMCTVYCTEYALLLGTEDIRSTVLVLLPRLDEAQWWELQHSGCVPLYE